MDIFDHQTSRSKRERHTIGVYLPSLAKTETYGKMTHMIAEETDFLAGRKPWELYREIKLMGGIHN